MSNTDLTQGCFDLPQEVVVVQLGCGVVNVIHRNHHFLHFFKEIVHHKGPGKTWVEAVDNIFRTANLKKKGKSLGTLFV